MCYSLEFKTFSLIIPFDLQGGLILNAILNDPDYDLMHITYNILVISSVVFSLLELIMSVAAPYYMRKLQILRIEHRLDDEDEEKEEKKERKASLARVFSLAKPVSENIKIRIMLVYIFVCMHPTSKGARGIMFSGYPSVRESCYREISRTPGWFKSYGSGMHHDE